MTDETLREFSALVARLSIVPRGQRFQLLSRLLPFLADSSIPAPVRISAAARALRVLPDRDRPIRRLARAITTGLSRSQGLERLRQLQHQVETCESLDRLIEEREKRLRLACPRCHARLVRVEMVKHLWHEHGLILERGKARSTIRVFETLQEQHATTGATEPLDRVAAQAGITGLRKWLASDDLPPEELSPLLSEAREKGAGLCPACLAEVPAAVAALPEPLTFGRGRLAGEGYAIELGGNAWFRTLRVTTGGKTLTGRRSLAPRAVATLAAAAVLAVTLALAQSLIVALGAIALAIFVYTVARVLSLSALSPADRAVDAAWSLIAERLTERAHAARFLTRLCLSSVDRGEPELRSGLLTAIVQRALGKAAESDAELQLLAATRALQIEDMSRFGRDVTAGISALAADGFTGVLPADYAEFVVGCYLTQVRDLGELGRLRILLLEAAFDAGLAPRDLIHLWSGAPNLRRAMAVEPTHRLGLLFGLWRTREAKSWESVAEAVTVFTLARTSPPTAARLLAHYPDLLILHRPHPDVEALLGPILVCARGVSVDGVFTADPAAEVRLTSEGRGLVFGRHRFDVSRRLPAELPDLITNWLHYRAESLVPFIEESLASGSDEVVKRVLGPFCRRCLACGTISVVPAGAIGQIIPL